MTTRLAFSGKPLAGKTTLARLLVEQYGYRRASMSGVIVDELVRSINAPWSPLTEVDVYENKEAFRPALQALGDQLGFQNPDRIIGIMQRALQLVGAWYHPEEPVILDAIRGELQASAARALGFIVVDVWVDEETQRQRAGSEEVYQKVRESMRARPDLENGLEWAEVRITNEFPLLTAAKMLRDLPGGVMSHGPANQPFEPGSLADWGRIG